MSDYRDPIARIPRRAGLPRKGVLNELDERLAELRDRWPAWSLWYVPCTELGGSMTIKWCAQPLPLLNANSIAEPEEYMAAAGIPVPERDR